MLPRTRGPVHLRPGKKRRSQTLLILSASSLRPPADAAARASILSFGLDSLSYVGNLFFTENYYAEDLGGNFGPLVVAGLNPNVRRYPDCPGECPDQGVQSSTFVNCKVQCDPGKGLNEDGGFTSTTLPANDPKCEAITPTPSPVPAPVPPQPCTGCGGIPPTSGVCKAANGLCYDLSFGTCPPNTLPC